MSDAIWVFKMNKKQKIILAIFIPVLLFFIALTIANSVGVTSTRGGGLHRFSQIPSKTPSHTHNPFDWEKTWYVWIAYFIIIFIFEYKFFSDKNIPDNKKRKDKVNG